MARLDLADVERDVAQAALLMSRMLGLAGIVECLLVLIDDAEAHWLDELTVRLGDAGLNPTGGWQVGSDSYWPLADPSDRHPLEDIASSSVAAQFVLAGYSPQASRADLADRLEPYPDGLRARLAARAASLETRTARLEAIWAWAGLLGDPGIPAPRPSRSSVQPRPLNDKATAALLAAITDVRLRDALLASAIAPGQPHQVCLRAFAGEDAEDWRLAELNPPDPDRLDAATAAVTHLARAGKGVAATQALAMLAYLHWWHGEGTMANIVVQRALELNPSHSLADLVANALEAGMPPPWRIVASGEAEARGA